MAGEKELRVKITADSAQFLNAVKGVNSSLGSLISTVGKFQLSTVGIVAGLSSVGAGLAKIIKSTADYGDELSKSSQKIGISVEALSGLQYAAKLSDVTNEQLITGLKKLSLNLFDAAQGTGEAKDAFLALDIPVKDSNNNLRSSSDILLEVADKLKNMEDGAGKTALMMKMFGKSGADLIPLMNQGAKGIKEATDEAAAFGQVISTGAAVAAEEFNDNLSRMTAMASGVVYSIGNELIPTINNLTEAWLNYNRRVSETPSVWEEMWKKISPSAEIQSKIEGLGFMQGGKFFIGEGAGGTIPAYQEPKKKKSGAPAVVDEAAEKAAKAAEDAAQKHKEWQFKMRAEGAAREEEFHKTEIQSWIDSENARWEWEQATADARIALEEKVTAAKIAAAQRQQEVIVGSLAFISRSALREHKAFFAITKAADMAQAVMDTYAAATKALATVPYPYNFAVAALVTAAGLANVQKIASTSFGGKGSGGGGAAASQTSGAGVGAQGSTFVANQPTRSVQVVVHGNIIDHAAFVRELQPYFREVAVDTV